MSVRNPTTDEYWDVDGFILNRLAYNIRTLAGRSALPAPKGSDVGIPYLAGDSWRAKRPAGRTITLAMWVAGTRAITSDDPTIDDVTLYNDNLSQLIKTFYVMDRQIAITKRWRTSDGAGGYILKSATAMGQYAGGLDPTMAGRTLGQFSVDLRLADPWFYAPSTATPHIVRGGATQDLTNNGHAILDGTGVSVEFHGPLGAGTQLTATKSGKPDVNLTLNYALGSGDVATFDIKRFIVTLQDGTNLIQSLTHSGHRAWMVAWRGTTTYQLHLGSGSGYAIVNTQEAYA